MTRAILGGAASIALMSLMALPAASPAAAQFACTDDGTTRTCTNTGTDTSETNTSINENVTTINSGTVTPGGTSTSTTNGNATTTSTGTIAGGILNQTTNGNATVNNSGSNVNGLGIINQTIIGDATVTNSGSNVNGISNGSQNNGAATVTNSGSNVNGIDNFTVHNGAATVTNSGSNVNGIENTAGIGDATVTNSGSTIPGIINSAVAGDATVTNSGNASGGISNLALFSGNATVTNSGNASGGINNQAVNIGHATVTNSGNASGGIINVTHNGSAAVTNSGNASGGISNSTGTGDATVTNSGLAGPIVNDTSNGNAILTNIVGGRVVGAISLSGTANVINFQGGNWLFTIGTVGPTNVNTGGAPFVVAGSFGSKSGAQVAVLDPTSFALADRSLMNFTGEVSQMLQDRFAGMAPATGGGTALGFAPSGFAPSHDASGSGIAADAQAAFAGIPSVAMSYASNPKPVIGKAPPPAAVPYYDTTVWASGFGGERHQRADGDVLPADDWAYGGAMGVDRVVGPNLRLGAFVGAGASREQVELGVQAIDATYTFGGGYGRFDWATQYLDFALYGGSIDNKSTRGIANNTVPSGFENATASYGGWFISPELTYGYRIPFNTVTVTPGVRLRYVGGALDGYSETGSAQNLSVGGRSINDIEERGEFEFSTVTGPMKSSVNVGVIGIERLSNPTINTVLLGQNLSFVTPGQASAVGGVLGARPEYRLTANAGLFLAGEGTAMSDKSDSLAGTGGAHLSF